MNKKIKTGLIFLNILLLLGIIIGQYEWLEPKTIIHVFFITAFVISASLFPLAKESKKKKI
ncbi:hypothetical protein ACNI3T_13730 [Christiangramia sp. ASW11-125]|uniref:hypothetical protein n=1 Tax=Christiangramia sp. ASW11-125 TaxID=3400701 RepID=UPI003AACED12